MRVVVLSGQARVSEPLPDDLRYDKTEAARVVKLFPIVIAEGLLVQVAKQMERLDADIGAVQPALQEAPEVLHAVSVDIAVDVFYRVIDDRVIVIISESVIGFQLVDKERASSFDVFADSLLGFFFAASINAKMRVLCRCALP